MFDDSSAISTDCRTINGWAIKTAKAEMSHSQSDTTIDVRFPGGLADHLVHGDTFGMCRHGDVLRRS